MFVEMCICYLTCYQGHMRESPLFTEVAWKYYFKLGCIVLPLKMTLNSLKKNTTRQSHDETNWNQLHWSVGKLKSITVATRIRIFTIKFLPSNFPQSALINLHYRLFGKKAGSFCEKFFERIWKRKLSTMKIYVVAECVTSFFLFSLLYEYSRVYCTSNNAVKKLE